MTWLRVNWDRAGAWACVGLGSLLLVLGWIGVSSTGYVAEQLPYLASGGIGGLFLLGIGGMLWLSADLSDEWRKLDRIEEVLTRSLPAEPEEPRVNGHAPVPARAGRR